MINQPAAPSPMRLHPQFQLTLLGPPRAGILSQLFHCLHSFQVSPTLSLSHTPFCPLPSTKERCVHHLKDGSFYSHLQDIRKSIIKQAFRPLSAIRLTTAPPFPITAILGGWGIFQFQFLHGIIIKGLVCCILIFKLCSNICFNCLSAACTK